MKAQTFNRILSVTAVLITLTIITVTIVFFIITKGESESIYRKMDPSPQKIINMNSGKENTIDAFTDMGQIRVISKRISETEEPAVVVLTPWFSYPAGDKTLFEELSQKDRQIKAVFIDYFSAMTIDQIKNKGEDVIKQDLLKRINENLVMGQIREVYFNDYIFIE